MKAQRLCGAWAHMSIIYLGSFSFFYCLKLCLELLFKIIRKEEKECFDFNIKENFLLFLFLACFHLQLVKLVSEILNVRFVGFYPISAK